MRRRIRMKNKEAYHHGNLQKALLYEGLKTLGQKGEDGLSLRELAKRCGVSVAAPYAHFKNKDEFIYALQDEVMRKLVEKLEITRTKYCEEKSILIEMGMSYVLYFVENPHHFSLLFSKSEHVQAVLWQEDSGKNPAFDELRKAAEPILSHFGVPQVAQHNILLAMWALVHGLAAIVCLHDIASRLREDPEALHSLRNILTVFSGPEPQ